MQLQRLAQHTWTDVLQGMLLAGFTTCQFNGKTFDVAADLDMIDRAERQGMPTPRYDYLVGPMTGGRCEVIRPFDGQMIVFTRPAEVRPRAPRGGIPAGQPAGGPWRDGYDA